MHPLELDDRVAAISTKSQLMGLNLHKDVAQYIASIVGSNLHGIKGALSTLSLYLDAINQEISLEKAKEILGDVFNSNENNNDNA